MRTYAIVKVFSTIQGEGVLAGTPATFIRFGGCNMWTGIEERRELDAMHNGARCPLWCDTDFAVRERRTARELADMVKQHASWPLIVLTGGEPLLQVDRQLINALHAAVPNAKIQIETNGTVEPEFGYHASVFLTCSPKVPRSQIKLTQADELKIVWPAYDPSEWESFPARYYTLTPLADAEGRNTENELALANYVHNHPHKWRMSLQLHKVLGLE